MSIRRKQRDSNSEINLTFSQEVDTPSLQEVEETSENINDEFSEKENSSPDESFVYVPRVLFFLI